MGGGRIIDETLIGRLGVAAVGVTMSQAVVRILGVEIFGRHPAELARGRSDPVPGAAMSVVVRRFEDFDHFAAVQPHLNHVANVAEAAADPRRHALFGHNGQVVLRRLQESAGDPGKAAVGGPNRRTIRRDRGDRPRPAGRASICRWHSNSAPARCGRKRCRSRRRLCKETWSGRLPPPATTRRSTKI